MYISLKWVQNLVCLDFVSLSTFCEQLTLAGFEIEEIIQDEKTHHKDLVLNIGLTANRSDLFNLKGFVRELFSLFFQEKSFSALRRFTSTIEKKNKLLRPPSSRFLFSYCWENFLQNKYFYFNPVKSLESKNFESTSFFFSIESKKFTRKLSPPWLQKSLASSTLESKNIIFDIINFVALETGIPFFVLDLNKLKEAFSTSNLSFSLGFGKPEERFTTNSNESFLLNENHLVVKINNLPVSILSLKTLNKFEVNKNTTAILIYAGLFDCHKLRKSSQFLGIRTDQSLCLEKGFTLPSLEQGFLRLKHLFATQKIYLQNKGFPQLLYINKSKTDFFLPLLQKRRPLLKLEFKEVKSILGEAYLLPSEKILEILKGLNCIVFHSTSKDCLLFIPQPRQKDLEREIDLIEEVVRINGFTSFPSFLPISTKVGEISSLEKLRRLCQNLLINLGFNEVLHYSISKNQGSDQLQLKNPILESTSYFRKSLLHQLIQKTNLNKKQKNKFFEGFEVGKVFFLDSKGFICEYELLAGIFGGKLTDYHWNQAERSMTWFQAKGTIEQIFKKLNLVVDFSVLEEKNQEIFHPYRSAQIYCKKENLGWFGQIHPFQAKVNNLDENTYLFEWNLEKLNKVWKQKKIFLYQPYFIYPGISVDLALIVSNRLPFQKIKNRIFLLGFPLLESLHLFDFYFGPSIPKGYHSLGLSLSFKAFDRTLTNEEVNQLVQEILLDLQRNFEINLRS